MVTHTCKAKSSGKLQFRNRHFVISGVLSLPPPSQTKIIVAALYSSLLCCSFKEAVMPMMTISLPGEEGLAWGRKSEKL